MGLGNKSNAYSPQKSVFLSKSSFIKVSAGSFSGSLTADGQIYVWGKGVFGEFLKPTLLTKKDQYFIDIQINDGFGLGLDSQSNIYSWGENQNGQLGIGNLENKSEMTLVKKIKGKNINKFACGLSDFCIGIGDFITRQPVIEGIKK